MNRGRGLLLSNSDDLMVAVKRDGKGLISSGVVIGGTTTQNQAMILYCHPGELKHAPAVGVGISNILLDHDTLAWRLLIRRQLETDGQAVERLTIDRQLNLEIHAQYR